MTVPETRNARIALAKGWTFDETATGYRYTRAPELEPLCWRTPLGVLETLPDWVGTLAGVAGLMRELNELKDQNGGRRFFWWRYNSYQNEYQCGCEHLEIVARSDRDRPGDCVGDAYLSVFEEEDADAG